MSTPSTPSTLYKRNTVLDTVDAALGQIEQAAQSSKAIEFPKDALAFLKGVYQSSALPLSVRMRAAIAALPFEMPKLAVTANIQHKDFGALLDARIRRLAEAQPKVIEAAQTPSTMSSIGC